MGRHNAELHTRKLIYMREESERETRATSPKKCRFTVGQMLKLGVQKKNGALQLFASVWHEDKQRTWKK